MSTAKEREAYGYTLPSTSSQALPSYTPASTGRSIKKQISSSSSKNSDLLATLADTHTAPADLNRVTIDLEDLRKLLSSQNDRVAELTKNSKRDYKQHKKYRDSIVKQWVYRLVRKPQEFDAKAMKEEKMYFDSLQDLRKAESRRAEIQTSIKEKEKSEKTLETAAAKHGDAHKKLDQLYQKIFTGPNPEFPEEDVREENFNKAVTAYENAKARYKTATDNINRFNRSAILLRQARSQVQHARDDLEYSFFGASEYHFKALARSQAKMLEISKYIFETKVSTTEPDFQREKVELLNSLRRIDIATPDVYTRHELLQFIAQRQQAFRTITELLANLMQASRTARSHEESLFRRSARSLEDARQALQQQRQAAFEEVAGFGEAPPAYGEARDAEPDVPTYHECCDRTAAFEQCDFQGPSGEEEAEGDLTGTVEWDRLPEGAPAGENGSDPQEHAIAQVTGETEDVGDDHAARNNYDGGVVGHSQNI